LSHSKAPQQVYIDDIDESGLENPDDYDNFDDEDLDDLGFDNIDDYNF